MDKQTYLKKFSYAVRWRLSKQEADEVLADYEELFSQAPREDDDLVIQKLGAPSPAARRVKKALCESTRPKAFPLPGGRWHGRSP